MEENKVIRPDIAKILELREEEFKKWYFQTKKATEALLDNYKIFGQIPVLDFGGEMTTGMYYTIMKGHIEALENGRINLEKTRDVYNKIHHTNYK